MDPVLLALAVSAGLYMAWSIGANDAANAMGTSVGSGAITLRQAILIAAIFEFAGAFLVGGHVTETIRQGIVDISSFRLDPHTLALGMFAALLAAGSFLMLASRFALPVSTTHAIVGAVVGFGIAGAGFECVRWGKLAAVASSWVISPLVGGCLAAVTYVILRKLIIAKRDPGTSLRSRGPVFVIPVATVLVLSFVYKGLKKLHLDLAFPEALAIAIVVGLIGMLIMRLWFRRISPVSIDDKQVERVFAALQVLTACMMAFAHGSNDVANAIGPLAAIVQIAREGNMGLTAPVPLWLLGLGGFGIVIGLWTYGYKVIGTIGEKLTQITPASGFSAEFGAATTVLVCSKFGLPVSTTHTIVGAVVGVGLVRGMAALDLAILGRIVSAWFVQFPITAALSAVFFLIAKAVF
jgi:PiT family inorganic phosphate transporter